MNRSKTQTQMLIYDRIISQLNTRNVPQSKTTINTSPPETLYQQLIRKHEEGGQYE